MTMCYSPFAICSPMTDHTVDTDLFFTVASQTLAHDQSVRLGFLHCFDRAVTGLTLDTGPNMRPVLEEHKIRHRSYFDPLDRLLLIPVILQLLDFGLVRCGNLMTTHAALDRRDTRHTGAPGIAMAVLARYFVITCVDLMAEGDRLNGARRLARKSQSHSDSYDKEGQQAYPDQPLFHAGLFFTERAYVGDELMDLCIC